jgi:preprotein translocase subunit SecA
MRHYDVQLIGGDRSSPRQIAEMKTGEGKTWSRRSRLPQCPGRPRGPCHYVNDYLARRDTEWMGQIYRFLGLTVGCTSSMASTTAASKEAYGSDITYGTNNEFGFDYLRDNMKFDMARWCNGIFTLPSSTKWTVSSWMRRGRP